ncbi:hypothetical protein [Roseovarius sp. MBR-78]
MCEVCLITDVTLPKAPDQ